MNKYIYDVKNIFSILPKNLKKKFNLIFFLLAIGGLLETLGIGILIPLINIIISDNTKIPILGNIINFDDFSKIQLIIILGVIIFSLYFVKAIYLSFLEFFIQKFSLRVNSEVTTQLFKTYLNNPYKFIFTNNSSVLFRNLTSEVSNFCAGIIEPLIMAAKEFFIISLIISMLIAINYKISLIIIIFSIIFFLIVKISLKKILYELGKKEQQYKGLVNKTMLEALQGFKFIKSYKIENIFVNNLYNILKGFIKIKYKSTAYRTLPRIWIEFFIILLLIILGIIFFFLGSNFSEFAVFVSIFLISMFKVMPSLISFTRVVNTFHNYKASINLIKKELNQNNYKSSIENKKIEKEKLIENFDIIECKNLFFKYDNDDKPIINNLSLEIKRKEQIIGICGPSGSGKTTLVDLLIGLLKPNDGNFYIDKKKVVTEISKQQLFGYVPQNTFLFDDTIEKNILITTKDNQISSNNYLKVIKQSELYEFIQTLSDKDKTVIGENGVRISGGQKQRIGIARALISQPNILIFDEATSALDVETEKNIFKTIKLLSKNISIIVISHNERIWNYCTHLYKLQEGKLIEKKI